MHRRDSCNRSSGSSATTPTDSSPVFDPKTGAFYFLRNLNGSDEDQVWEFSTRTNKGKQIGSMPQSVEFSNAWITRQDGRVVAGDELISPNGSLSPRNPLNRVLSPFLPHRPRL